jgi:hypothetical protein
VFESVALYWETVSPRRRELLLHLTDQLTEDVEWLRKDLQEGRAAITAGVRGPVQVE